MRFKQIEKQPRTRLLNALFDLSKTFEMQPSEVLKFVERTDDCSSISGLLVESRIRDFTKHCTPARTNML